MSELTRFSESGVQYITFSRVSRRNALTRDLAFGLTQAIETAFSDDSTKVIVIRSEGKDFCSGLDLYEAAKDTDGDESFRIYHSLLSIVERSPKPIISSVQGRSWGGGFGLALNSHFIVATRSANFSLSESKIGMWPFIVSPVVIRRLGEPNFLKMAISGEGTSAVDGKSIGFVDVVVETHELMDRTRLFASQIAEIFSPSIAIGLEFSNASRTIKDPAEWLSLAIEYRRRACLTEKFKATLQRYRIKSGER